MVIFASIYNRCRFENDVNYCRKSSDKNDTAHRK